MTREFYFDLMVKMEVTMGLRERRKREEKARLASILAAAETVFAAQGYYQARMDDIAEKAELSKGALYYYFKSKDQIYFHLLEREAERVEEEIRRRIVEGTVFIEALEAVIDFYLEYFDRNPAYLKIVLPCLCGVIKFEDESMFRESFRGYQRHGEFIRAALKVRLAREKLPFDLDSLMKFVQTLQIGIGFRLLEGKKAEAAAAAGFFLDLTKRLMEAQS